MHTCPPPAAALEAWLGVNGTIESRYGHLLLEQRATSDAALVASLRPYFESAHLDAREHFHEQIGIDLHPDAGAAEATLCYPACLPAKARRGLFGEVMAGLVTEAYQTEFVGSHPWAVPIFLFREHADVEAYLWALKSNPDRTREIYGRHGSDFIGLSLGSSGEVLRVIVGEAKWRASLTKSVVEALLLGPKEEDKETGERVHNGKGIWFEVNRDSPIPHGLRQLQRLLERRDPDGHATTILSIDQAVLGQAARPDRTNLILIVGNGAKTRKAGNCLIPWEEVPEAYAAPDDLQVVEVILEGGEALIDRLYTSLWSSP